MSVSSPMVIPVSYTHLTDYIEETKPRLLEKDMKLSLEIHANSPCDVRMDRLQFGRVVSNLVDNSVKYKRVGLGRLKVMIQEQHETVQILSLIHI